MSAIETSTAPEDIAAVAYAKARQYEMDYGCCPQCLLAALQETVGLVDDQLIKASHGLSGGGGLGAKDSAAPSPAACWRWVLATVATATSWPAAAA